jgi:hypothetical protein
MKEYGITSAPTTIIDSNIKVVRIPNFPWTCGDDGEPQPLVEWANREIFQAHGHLDVEREERRGLELIGPFHSDQWDMATVWRFEVINGRVRRLDVAAM